MYDDIPIDSVQGHLNEHAVVTWKGYTQHCYSLTKLRPLFTLSNRGSDNSPLLFVYSAYYMEQSMVTFMRLNVG